jgi:glyoxylase-like metal-dependent hydrolase (beta-lactamase superfamily II)
MPDSKFEVFELEKGGWRIEDNGVRALLFEGSDKALLVDSGFGKSGSIKEVVSGLTKKPVMLVNSHADGDHVGGNGEFDKAWIHPSEFPYYNETCPEGAEACPIWDGEIIDLGGRKFEVILIPGHTPGSVALLDRENRILVAGDSISDGPIFMFGKNRSLQAFIYSMKKLLTFSSEFDTILPAHGPCPLGNDMIGKLIDGAEQVLSGKVEGTAPTFDIPAKVYRAGGAAFLYSFGE